MSLPYSFCATALLASSAALVSCINDDELPPPIVVTAPVTVGDAVGLTSTGRVVSFGRAPSANLSSNVAITGLAAGESLVGIDFRPATQTIYALSGKGTIYLLNPATGAVSTPVALKSNTTTPINTNACTPAVTAFTALSGTQFGLDFNPSVDRLRIVSDTGQNLRVNVATGDTTVDCGLNVGGTTIKASAAAYTNSVPGTGPQTPAQATKLYYIDASTDMLYTTTAPNDGTLTAVGALGVDVADTNGFDISTSGTADTAYAVFKVTRTVNGTTTMPTGFYRIDLASGAATALADFSESFSLHGLALK